MHWDLTEDSRGTSKEHKSQQMISSLAFPSTSGICVDAKTTDEIRIETKMKFPHASDEKEGVGNSLIASWCQQLVSRRPKKKQNSKCWSTNKCWLINKQMLVYLPTVSMDPFELNGPSTRLVTISLANQLRSQHCAFASACLMPGTTYLAIKVLHDGWWWLMTFKHPNKKKSIVIYRYKICNWRMCQLCSLANAMPFLVSPISSPPTLAGLWLLHLQPARPGTENAALFVSIRTVSHLHQQDLALDARSHHTAIGTFELEKKWCDITHTNQKIVQIFTTFDQRSCGIACFGTKSDNSRVTFSPKMPPWSKLHRFNVVPFQGTKAARDHSTAPLPGRHTLPALLRLTVLLRCLNGGGRSGVSIGSSMYSRMTM